MAQPRHLRFREILIFIPDGQWGVDVADFGLPVQCLEDCLGEIAEAPRFPGSDVKKPQGGGVFHQLDHDFHAIADPNKVSYLAAVLIVRMVGVKQRRRTAD